MGFQLLRSLSMGYGEGWDSGTSAGMTAGCMKQVRRRGGGESLLEALCTCTKALLTTVSRSGRERRRGQQHSSSSWPLFPSWRPSPQFLSPHPSLAQRTPGHIDPGDPNKGLLPCFGRCGLRFGHPEEGPTDSRHAFRFRLLKSPKWPNSNRTCSSARATISGSFRRPRCL